MKFIEYTAILIVCVIATILGSIYLSRFHEFSGGENGALVVMDLIVLILLGAIWVDKTKINL